MMAPFVIAVASEKGGVGKTTIATNLAVYLKALREDLPVTVASFDNHFSVDQMFALGPRPERDMADLLQGSPATGLVNLGQFGVQYVASARRLQPPGYEPDELAARFDSMSLPGILILDTRPILDWFTEAALLAADLVLAPIKDRAALVNAESLRQVLVGQERADRLWLLQSLVDSRARLNADVKVHEFLAYAAAERNYQMLDVCISKSPKVESLASGFSSAVRPVITHARNTAVHGQFKALADFVLERFDRTMQPVGEDACVDHALVRRVLSVCPVCRRPAAPVTGHFFFDLRSRRRGYLHAACHAGVVDSFRFNDPAPPQGVLGLLLDGPGLVAPEERLVAYRCAEDRSFAESEPLDLKEAPSLKVVLSAMTGRALEEAYRELVLLHDAAGPVALRVGQSGDSGFTVTRRLLLRELRQAGLF